MHHGHVMGHAILFEKYREHGPQCLVIQEDFESQGIVGELWCVDSEVMPYTDLHLPVSMWRCDCPKLKIT